MTQLLKKEYANRNIQSYTPLLDITGLFLNWSCFKSIYYIKRLKNHGFITNNCIHFHGQIFRHSHNTKKPNALKTLSLKYENSDIFRVYLLFRNKSRSVKWKNLAGYVIRIFPANPFALRDANQDLRGVILHQKNVSAIYRVSLLKEPTSSTKTVM